MRGVAGVVTIALEDAREVDANANIVTNDSGEAITEEVDAREDSDMEDNDLKLSLCGNI